MDRFMKVDPVAPFRSTSVRRNERSAAGGKGEGFSKALSANSASETPTATPVGGGTGVGPVDSILALQEVAEDPGKRNRARRRGEELLDRLEDLRLALLEGRLPLATIEKLADLVAARRAQVNDRQLLAILDEIELRAAVELAKLGRY